MTQPSSTRSQSPFEQLLAARDFLLAHRTDYARAHAGFRWPQFIADDAPFNWALDWFDARARERTGDAPALWVVRDATDATQDVRLSYAELSERSSRIANYLRRCGVQRGDRLLVMLPNTPELWETLLAAMKLGAVVVPASTLLTPSDLAVRLARGGIRYVITDEAGADRCGAHAELTRIVVGTAPPGCVPYAPGYAETAIFVPGGVTRASDPLLLYFTSGTTAQPKLVLHTHASYPVGHLSTMYWLGLKPGDVHCNVSSPGWAKHAWSSVFAPLLADATILTHAYARFSADATLTVLRRCGANVLCAPPTVWRMLLLTDLGSRPAALRELASAGEPLNPEIIARVEAAWGLTLRDGFGQTETTAQIGNTPGQPVKPGSMGRPLPGYHVVTLGHDGAPADAGEVAVVLAGPGGDAAQRPAGVMVGYKDDDARTAAVMADGHYRTGDEAARDADGYFHYVGRGDDLFKSADYRLSPFELESALLEHPHVAEAAVVPAPDALRLSVPKAFVTLRPGTAADRQTARDVLRFLRGRLAPYQRVRRLEFMAELPKTISGKIRRVALRQLEEQRAAAGERPAAEFRLDDFPDLG